MADLLALAQEVRELNARGKLNLARQLIEAALADNDTERSKSLLKLAASCARLAADDCDTVRQSM